MHYNSFIIQPDLPFNEVFRDFSGDRLTAARTVCAATTGAPQANSRVAAVRVFTTFASGGFCQLSDRRL